MIIDDEYADFLLRVTRHFATVSPSDQIIKLSEEVGEVASAWIGAQGSNPRKGITHTRRDIAEELADVVITAFLGIIKLGFDPQEEMTKQQQKTEERLNASP